MAKGVKTGGGSRKGKPNKETKALREMILAALDRAGGERYLFEQAKQNPNAFMTLIGKVLPTQITGDPNAPVAISEIRETLIDPRSVHTDQVRPAPKAG